GVGEGRRVELVDGVTQRRGAAAISEDERGCARLVTSPHGDLAPGPGTDAVLRLRQCGVFVVAGRLEEEQQVRGAEGVRAEPVPARRPRRVADVDGVLTVAVAVGEQDL